MAEEEIKQKAEEWYKNTVKINEWNEKSVCTTYMPNAITGFIAGAKLMQKENAELKAKLDFFLTEEKDGKEYRPKWEVDQLKEENNKLLDVINNQDVKIADLEEDLKHKKIAIQTRNKRIADLIETCKDKDRQLDNWYKEWQKQDKQLEQAKGIIKHLLWDLRNKDQDPAKDIEKAEHFLGRDKISKEAEEFLKEDA